jgi:hypothetical protein
MNIYVQNTFITVTDYATIAKKETISQTNANSTLKQDQEAQVRKN